MASLSRTRRDVAGFIDHDRPVRRTTAKVPKISAQSFFIGVAPNHRALIPSEQMESAKKAHRLPRKE